ncbi:hypothetical protein EYF80_056097 [Liparis tanakae]|uniref:Uncharacterized protein n=1 Tax=Liparis tanakae TaxID=230148 RepID=A0A4Z2EYY4_9TELE|nr:hypothetical protein EYF80_056097 [Liparis tanakae]
MKHRLLYNQMSLPLVVRRENAALTHEASTSIQPEESPPGGQERECIFNTSSLGMNLKKRTVCKVQFTLKCSRLTEAWRLTLQPLRMHSAETVSRWREKEPGEIGVEVGGPQCQQSQTAFGK